MHKRFSSPSVLLARGGSDLLMKAHALAKKIHALQHPQRIPELDIETVRLLGGDRSRTEVILRRAVQWGMEKLGASDLGREWSLRISKSNPKEALVQYFPDDGVLEMQQRALETFREVDAVVVAVHEVLGHHVQETRVKNADRSYYMSSRRDTQEGCAMRCEADLLVGPLLRTGLEWQLFRVLRALEDMGKTTMWSLFPAGQRMPHEYVRSYVKQNPGLAQHYIFPSTDKYCLC